MPAGARARGEGKSVRFLFQVGEEGRARIKPAVGQPGQSRGPARACPGQGHRFEKKPSWPWVTAMGWGSLVGQQRPTKRKTSSYTSNFLERATSFIKSLSTRGISFQSPFQSAVPTHSFSIQLRHLLQFPHKLLMRDNRFF